MDKFVIDGIVEYRLQKRREAEFEKCLGQMLNIVGNGEIPSDAQLKTLLTPMIEMAWIDGQVGRAEQGAILKAADAYGLLENIHIFSELMGRLTIRPTSEEIEGWWNEIYLSLAELPTDQLYEATTILFEQVRYIAGLSLKREFGPLRGYSTGENEALKISEVHERVTKLRSSALDLSDNDASLGNVAPIDDLLRVLPLVKVAWADGRITKREREMIFGSLSEIGINPTRADLTRLSQWLELSPDDDFFAASIDQLRKELETLGDDRRADEKYSLISRCTLVAEVSGGNSKFRSGGTRICAEEVAAVKHIARLLIGPIERRSQDEQNSTNGGRVISPARGAGK